MGTASFPLNRKELTIGRDPSSDVRLGGIGVSKFHAKITVDEQGIVIRDLDSSSGIRINGVFTRQGPLCSGDILTIGVHTISVFFDSSALTLTREQTTERYTPVQEPENSEAITIGRDPANRIRLDHPMVSRFHATVVKNKNRGFHLEDHGSANGTFVNGKSVRSVPLSDGDIVIIGPHRFYLDAGIFLQSRDFNRIKLEAFGVSVIKNGHVLVDNVSLSIDPGEFVAILGPSGAGKSTLAHALMGNTRLANGSVLYNGLGIKGVIDAYRAAIGFVTQDNLVRSELTVEETLREQCLLRLPKDSSALERTERVREVMDLLDLTGLARRRVGAISGGEAKRVHFGVELLSSPTIIFLDEPFAGLDPGLIHKFMALFRKICDQGHSLLLTTHTLEQIDLCNRVFFLNGGKLVFSGPASEIKSRYGVSSLAAIYEQEHNPVIKKRPLAEKGTAAIKKGFTRASGVFKLPVTRPLYKPKIVGIGSQCRMLITRYFKISLRDTRNLVLMLVQAPLIALVLFFTFSADGDYFPLSFYFCLSISAIWMGGMNSVREIAREWAVIDREFRIGLSPAAYVASKILVFGALSISQALLFGACVRFLFKDFPFTFAVGLVLSSACFSGAILGLCMSVLSKNVNMAISWLPIVFVPQIFFSGILAPFDEMSGIGRALSHLTLARPIFSMFKELCFPGRSVWALTQWRALFFLCFGLIILMAVGIRYRRFAA